MNTVAIKAAAALVDQLDALKTVRDQVVILQGANQSFLTISVSTPIAGDTTGIANTIAESLTTSMSAAMTTNFLTANDTAIATIQAQIDAQVALIDDGEVEH